MEGCPVGTPIKDVIKLLLEDNIVSAGEKLFENNPLSVICSQICPHELQCEGSCVLNNKSSSVEFSAIEHYISDYYLNVFDPKPNIDPDRKVALIGSGPAGITIAFLLAAKGYNITIFEAHDKIGGVLRYGIPDFRLPKRVLERMKDKLLAMGVKIRPNTLIGPTLTVDDLFRDGYKAVFIGTGVWKPKKLNIKGESLGNVHYAIDYLKNPDVYNLGNRVCVIGAGNSAMDVARTAIRNGSREVYIIYRNGPNGVAALQQEVQYAKMDGVKFEFYTKPLEIVDNGFRYIKTREQINDDGGVKVVDVEGTEGVFEADSIIIAISQGPRANIVSNTKGIEVDGKGLVTTDDLGRTTREGVFASGDVVTGAKTVVEAVRFSKEVARCIDEYIIQKYGE
jgi:glutamate synthase (NADPH/NADH) small chain